MNDYAYIGVLTLLLIGTFWYSSHTISQLENRLFALERRVKSMISFLPAPGVLNSICDRLNELKGTEKADKPKDTP